MAALFDRLGVPAGPTESFESVALAVLGWGIGAGITSESMATLRWAAVPLLLMVVTLLLFRFCVSPSS